MRERLLAFIDIETTGLEFNHEIIELACILVEQKNLEIIEQFVYKVKPKNLEMADKESLKIAHFDKELWEKEAIELKDALKTLEEKSRDAIMIGQNFTFDWTRLEKALFENGFLQSAFYYHRLDLMSMAFLKFYNEPKLKRFSLRELCDYFEVKQGKAHSALDDAMATYEVYKKLINS